MGDLIGNHIHSNKQMFNPMTYCLNVLSLTTESNIGERRSKTKNKMRFNFKKISAIATSALMLGMSAGVAAAANYPAPFVSSGVGDVAIVYGSGAASSDAVAAGNINQDLGESVTGASTTDVDLSGEIVSLDTSATKIWLNTSLNTAKSVFTKSDLPTILADGTFSGNVDATMTQTIKFAAGAAAGDDNSGKVIYAKQPSSNNDPVFGVSLGTSQTDDILYNATVSFSAAVAFNHTDSEGETINLFGREFVVSTATDATKLVLFSSAEEVALSLGGTNPSSTTVVIDGTEYTVQLVTGTSTTATVAVNGESKEINEGSSKKIGGIDVAVKSVTESTAISTIEATLLVGSKKITFQAGSAVLMGSDDDPVDGTYVYLTGTPDALTGMTIAVFRPDSTDDAIVPGDVFTDPVFESFKVDFVGISNDESSSDRETIEVSNSGDDTMIVKFTDSAENTKSVEFAHNASGQFFLGDDNNYTLNVIEMANLSENEYTVVGNEEYGHILQLTDIYNTTTGSSSITNDRVRFNDVMDGTTYSTVFTSTEGSGTLTIDGKEYTVTFGGSDDTGWAQIKAPTADSANADTFVVFPTIKTKNGALVSLYKPLDITLSAIDGGSSTTATLNFPDGDGYTSVVFTGGGAIFTATNANWTVTGGGVTNEDFNTSVGVTDQVDFTIGTLVYNITCLGVTQNLTRLYVTDPEGTANIDQPALIIWEPKDDLNAYEAVIVDLETNPAGSSSDGVGVNDVLFSANRYHGSATLASDSDITKDVDWYGTITTLNADDSDQKKLTVSMPSEQVYSKIYLGEIAASTGATGQLGGVVVKDTETAQYSGKNVIVVGGSCINSAAAALVGGALCGAEFTANTGVGTGQFLIKGYASSTITSKHAMLVAGYEAADTNTAATYLMNNAVDTSAEYKGTTSTVTATKVA